MPAAVPRRSAGSRSISEARSGPDSGVRRGHPANHGRAARGRQHQPSYRRRLAGQVAGRDDVEHRREVPGAAVHGKSPGILQREIRRDLADPPGEGFVHCVRKPHGDSLVPYGIVWIVGRAACVGQYGAV